MQKLLFVRIVFTLLLSTYFCLVGSTKVHALEGDFDITLVTNYYVDSNARTSVVQEVTLTNQSSAVYATDYAFAFNSKIEDITARWVDGDDLPFITSEADTGTIVTVNFDEKIVGKNQALGFVLEYQQPDVSHLSGNVLEVNLPLLSQQNALDTYQIVLHVPESFGQPAQLNPLPDQITTLEGNSVYTFSQAEGASTGIIGIFGDTQDLSFTLNYHLDNPTVNKALTQITIPPDTPYQKLYYDVIDPIPDTIETDNDGNWLATYLLNPKETVDVVVQGHAQLYLTPTVAVHNYSQTNPAYTSEQKFWPVTDPKVQALASNLEDVSAVYSHIIETFTYNYNKLDGSTGRLGGAQALQEPSNALCQEFTDAFITLARAKGIPARAHNGYAFTQNPQLRPLSLVKDVLHAWPEYYDQTTNQWKRVDPTWQNTTGGIDYFNSFDLNHFTFVIHGMDSQKPYPAGYYKDSESNDKDVLVEFAESKPEKIENIEVWLEPHFISLLGIPSWGKLSIKNTGNTAIYDAPISLESDQWKVFNPVTSEDVLLPYNTTNQRIYFRFYQPFGIQKISQVKLQDKQYEFKIIISTGHYISLAISIVSLGITLIIVTLVTRRLLVSRRK